STSLTPSSRPSTSLDCWINCGPAGQAGVVIVISIDTFDLPSPASAIVTRYTRPQSTIFTKRSGSTTCLSASRTLSSLSAMATPIARNNSDGDRIFSHVVDSHQDVVALDFHFVGCCGPRSRHRQGPPVADVELGAVPRTGDLEA